MPENNVSIESYIANITTDYKSGNKNKFNLLKLLIDKSTDIIKTIPTSITTRKNIETVLHNKENIENNIEQEIKKYSLIIKNPNNFNKYDTHNADIKIYLVLYYIVVIFIILFELYIFFIYNL